MEGVTTLLILFLLFFYKGDQGKKINKDYCLLFTECLNLTGGSNTIYNLDFKEQKF